MAVLVSQRLAGLQHMLYTLSSLLVATEFKEVLSLKLQEIFFTDNRSRIH
jgi:hypothetical protein